MKRELPKVIKPCLSCDHRRFAPVDKFGELLAGFAIWGCVKRHLTFGADRVAQEAMPNVCTDRSL